MSFLGWVACPYPRLDRNKWCVLTFFGEVTDWVQILFILEVDSLVFGLRTA